MSHKYGQLIPLSGCSEHSSRNLLISILGKVKTKNQRLKKMYIYQERARLMRLDSCRSYHSPSNLSHGRASRRTCR